jgi:response regulator of citrate/malate metabolism
MDKETKALIDFYDNKTKELEKQNKEKQDKLDKIEEKINHEWFKRIQLGIIDKTFSEYELKNILQIIKGEDK